MRLLVMVKANKESEAGVLPEEKLARIGVIGLGEFVRNRAFQRAGSRNADRHAQLYSGRSPPAFPRHAHIIQAAAMYRMRLSSSCFISS